MVDMTAAPSWTILVATLGERRPLFDRLMAALLPQLDAYDGLVQVKAWHNNGRPSLPVIRQRMVREAQSEYVSWVDDDDLVPDYFVEQIVTALSTRPDYVGFDLQCYSNGAPTAISHHALKYGAWYNEAGGHYRDISHINPIRRELAMLADFSRTPQGQPEDRAWAAQLRRTRKVKTEVVVDRIMYHYLYCTDRAAGQGSRWQRPNRIHQAAVERSAIDHPYFTWSPDA
jgi:hypothetical protein